MSIYIYLYLQQCAENKEIRRKYCANNTKYNTYIQHNKISDRTPCNRIKTHIHCWGKGLTIWYM